MRFFYYMTFLFILTGCGESPLLNHTTEKNFSRAVNRFEVDAYKFAKTDYSFSVDWTQAPALGENKFILRSWHKDLGTFNGPYQNLPYELFTFLWMPDMGHGSAPTKMKQIAPGEYEVSNVYFIMKGAWELNIQLKQGSQVIDEVVLNYSL